jgi:hypothetical protein
MYISLRNTFYPNNLHEHGKSPKGRIALMFKIFKVQYVEYGGGLQQIPMEEGLSYDTW